MFAPPERNPLPRMRRVFPDLVGGSRLGLPFPRNHLRPTVQDMSWDVHTRRTYSHGTHIKVSWRALDSVYDVSLDCPEGVHVASTSGLVRREMNSFNEPIKAYIQWDEGVENPTATLWWTEAGEQFEKSIRLDATEGHARASSVRDAVRRVLTERPHLPGRSHAGTDRTAADA